MRPTISLACIMKNEAVNIGPMLQSFKGCFDEIVIVDTGSTDNSVEFIEKINAKIEAKDPDWLGFPVIKLFHFEWVNDFAKARQVSFDNCTSDYILWADLDDRLSDAGSFLAWRDGIMHSAHYWLVTYNYAFNDKGKVECQFVRERVVKNNHGFKWKYFVHEGLVQEEGRNFWPQKVTSWAINHARTEDDRKADHMRNIKLAETHDVETMSPRMKFYYGKELVEHEQAEKGSKFLMEALKSKELDIHDLLLAVQYAAQGAFKCKAYPQAMELLRNGTMLMLSRAEYWCLLGDIYLAQGALAEAKQSYEIALTCQPNDLNGMTVIYGHAYHDYPHMQLAKIKAERGDMKAAEKHVEALKSTGHESAKELENHIGHLMDLSLIRTGLPKTDDVIITCPPQGTVTDWDENTLKEKGHGGSETAAIEVARWIKQKTGRNVKIFQPRARREVLPSGVEYLPSGELQGYMQNIEPAAHIAWRHPIRLTNALSYIWCHDLQCPGASNPNAYDKIVALSGFHKKYLMETSGVPEDKIVLGFNGINPEDFKVEAEKDPLKVVFSSSPDRGLVQSVDIVKKARELSGLDIKLHCFYGTENMRKMGMTEWADKIEAKMKENSDFVVYHGMVTKKVLMKHFKEAAVWIYPADFIETYCITAIEALCSGTWPIVRDMGALKFTMKEAIEKGMCDILTAEVKDEASVGIWANALVEAIVEKKFQKVKVNVEDYSWEKVADFFIKEMSL